MKNLINEPTCFKNMDNPSCIDLVLTDKSSVIQTGLSDFHRLTITIMNTNLQKQTPKILSYRNYKNFENECFKNELLLELNIYDIHRMNCYEFENILMTILNIHAPLRKQYLRSNNAPFMNKLLSKAIMVRSRLRNKFLKSKTRETREAYKKTTKLLCYFVKRDKKIFL